MTTATLKQPARQGAQFHWLSDHDGTLIERQIQNTEVLTVKHQLEQKRLVAHSDLTRAGAALLDGDKITALRYIETAKDALNDQAALLEELERLEQKDVVQAIRDTERARTLRTLDFWRPSGDAR